MATFFTADHHFGHQNIIRACSRPFGSVTEMHEALIARWNEVVGPRDEVWHLGDFAYRCGPNLMSETFGRLGGRAIHLVLGNHDRKRTLELPWASVQRYAEIRVDGRDLVLFHYPMREWQGFHRGAWSLFGHCHGNLPDTPASCDVGVDRWDFRPVTLDLIEARLSSLR